MAHYRNDYFGRYSADQMCGKRDRLFGNILGLIEKGRDAGRLLDIGAGCGFFLESAQKRGWKVKGIEPSIQSVEVAQRQYGLVRPSIHKISLTLGTHSIRFNLWTIIDGIKKKMNGLK